jgi:hypothetical protein
VERGPALAAEPTGDPAEEPPMRRTRSAVSLAALAIVAGLAASAAQGANPRLGVWKLKSDAPPPALNIMTYEAYGDGGMKVTVEATNASGQVTKWSYVTMFDGVFRPVDGQEGNETAVEVVDEQTNKISNRRNGRVYQVIINVLSADGKTINNEYRRIDESGGERVSHAVYERIK